MSNEPDKTATDISWDAERAAAPLRPQLVSSIGEPIIARRPPRTLVAYALTIFAVLGFVAVGLLALVRLEDISGSLLDTLPADLVEGYSDDDQRRAVYVMLGAFAGAGLLLSALAVLTLGALVFRKSAAGRVGFVIFSLLTLPVWLVSASVRQGEALDTIVTAITMTCLITAIILVCTPGVSFWLRHRDHPRTVPLTELSPPTG